MAGIDTTIGSNVHVEGSLKNLGSIEINGEVVGEIASQEDIIVGETAKIKGPIVAKNVTVAGEVEGTIESSEKLEILPSGKVNGDINTAMLVIQQGAHFIGRSQMPDAHEKGKHADEVTLELVEEEQK